MNKAAVLSYLIQPPRAGAYLDSPISEERTQAAVRIALTSIALVLFTMLGLSVEQDGLHGLSSTLVAAGGYWFYSVLWALWIWQSNKTSDIRQVLTLFTDIVVISFILYITDDLGAFFYPAYQWIIIGHGIRFGSRMLLLASVFGVIGFSIVLLVTPFWQDNLISAIGLMLGLIVLPIYFLSLLRQLHNLNRQLKKELEQSLYAASHDKLTQLPNRQKFYERLDEDIKRARSHDNALAVMYIDLDGFKKINDAHGHHIGDEVLQHIAQRLLTICRDTDLAARLGGDEFAVIINEIEHKTDAAMPARRILELIEQPIIIQGQQYRLSASIGIGLYPHDGLNPEQLTRHADLAMYKIKHKEKNGFSFSHAAQDSA